MEDVTNVSSVSQMTGSDAMDNVQVQALALERRTGSSSFKAEGSTVRPAENKH